MFSEPRHTQGGWNDVNCGRAAAGPCPAGYISWYRNCYKLVEEPATWDAAQKACEQHGANLVSIDMSYDQAFVAGVVLFLNNTLVLCDLVLQDDGSFAWTDGWPVFFTQWGPGEPDNLKDEGCVSMRGSPLFHGTWNDTRAPLPRRGFLFTRFNAPPQMPQDGNKLQ
uniref:C-type lectin domain-containing protein n=1 Tax=Hippocampus comes TaxID=109280 RepID=A0A3Q2YEL3_HIPCM